MHQLTLSPDFLADLEGQTVIITGAARGIGAATAALFNSNGANTVIVDLPQSRQTAQDIIRSLPFPESAIFIPANVAEWNDLVQVFKLALAKFGRVDVVVANAAIMESSPVLDIELDAKGDPIESGDANRVLDVNLKGTFNLIKLALFYLSKNPLSPSGWRGSIVCITSTSGYFGATGNAAYIASKHGVVGLVRAALGRASSSRVKLNAIAPCYTPTGITAGLADMVKQAGLESNRTEDVALAIACMAADATAHGMSCLVWGKFKRELELTRQDLMSDWLGSDLVDAMAALGRVLQSNGGFPLPPRATTSNL